MADKKDANAEERALPPEGPMRTIMEEAQAAQFTNSQLCGRLEDSLDEIVRGWCGKKAFDQKAGNCGEGCRGIEVPKIVPCLHLRWGDGAQDHLETDDTEVLCITACNPYSNVTMKDFTLQLVVTTAGGLAVPKQPDGTDTVMIKPQFNICFGDLEPCGLLTSEFQKACVSREVVLINRGAIAGPYRVFVFYCFEACFTMIGAERAAFTLDLVAS